MGVTPDNTTMKNTTEQRKGMLAGQVAKELGVGVQTLHYYERERLIPPPRRAENGYRVYDASLVDRVRFVRKAQSLGLTLEEVKEIIELADRGACPCGHVHAALTARLKEVDDRLAQLRSFRSELAALVSRVRKVSSTATRSDPVNRARAAALCEIVEQASTTPPAGARFALALGPRSRRPRRRVR